jgi:hypothetical protein
MQITSQSLRVAKALLTSRGRVPTRSLSIVMRIGMHSLRVRLSGRDEESSLSLKGRDEAPLSCLQARGGISNALV